jgi:hypothetical protein
VFSEVATLAILVTPGSTSPCISKVVAFFLDRRMDRQPRLYTPFSWTISPLAVIGLPASVSLFDSLVHGLPHSFLLLILLIMCNDIGITTLKTVILGAATGFLDSRVSPVSQQLAEIYPSIIAKPIIDSQTFVSRRVLEVSDSSVLVAPVICCSACLRPVELWE